MKIGEVCKQADVSKELIRHYESLGLIFSQAEQAGSRKYRRFSHETLQRLELIKKGKQIGLSLKQIKPLLDAFVAHKMSRQEALEILENQRSKMNDIILHANEVKALIEQHIEKIQNTEHSGCLPTITKSGD